MREKGRLDWEATVGKIKKQGKPLFFQESIPIAAELNLVMSPKARDKLLRLFPAAESCLYPFVSRQHAVLQGEEGLPLAAGLSRYLSEKPYFAGGGGGAERAGPGELGKGVLRPCSREQGGAACSGWAEIPKRLGGAGADFPGACGGGELVIASRGNTLLQYGLLSSRMFRVWSNALSRNAQTRNLYQYVYNAFPVPKAERNFLEKIESAAFELAEGGNRAEKRKNLDNWVEELYGGPFASDEERLNRLAALFLSRKRPARTENKERMEPAGPAAPGVSLTCAAEERPAASGTAKICREGERTDECCKDRSTEPCSENQGAGVRESSDSGLDCLWYFRRAGNAAFSADGGAGKENQGGISRHGEADPSLLQR